MKYLGSNVALTALLFVVIGAGTLSAAGTKLSQITSGGAVNTATDTPVAVRSGTTDVLVTLAPSAGIDTTTTANITDSTDKRFVTDANLVTLGNTSGTNTGDVTLGTANGLSIPGQVLSLGTASTSTTGALTSTDWNTFNSKQAAGSYLTAVTSNAPLSGSGTSGSHLAISQAGAGSDGYLSSTDWNTFNSKGSGTVTSVSVVSANGFAGSSSGGATPAITLLTSITGIVKGNGTALSAATAGADYSNGTSALGTGILKSTTGTGALTIATAPDFPTLNQNTSGTAAAWTTGRTVSITGDIAYTSPSIDGTANVTAAGTLATVNSNVGTFGNFIVNGKGLITAASTALANGTTATTQVASDNSTKVATTQYTTTAITNALNGLDWKPAVGYASTANIVGVNVAGVFTYTATGTDVIDGHTLVLNDQVIFKNQTTGADNGVWVVTTAGSLGVAGVLTRRSDYNTAAEIHDGDTFYVTGGTVNGNTSWVQTDVVNTINSDPLAFSQVSGPGTYTAGTGLTLTGNSFSVNASQTQITALGTIGTGAWQGTKVGLAYGGTNADLSATGGTSQVLKQVSGGSSVTVGQLAFSDISGQATNAQLATQTANTVLGALTATTPSGLALPSCTDTSGNHLNYTSGTGFSCGTSDSHGGTVTSIATTSPITGGTITSTGTIACATCATTTNGGAISGTAPIAVSAAGVISGGGLGTVTGALKGNGSGTITQAACTDLSNGATGCSTATGTSGATIPLLNAANTWSGIQSFNSSDFVLKGSSSGTTTVNSGAAAGSSVLTLPVATDTLVGKATTDTLTNKTYDTAGTGNSFSINGLAATANTGTGAVVRAAGAGLTTPDLGTPSAAVLTNATGTAAGLTSGSTNALKSATTTVNVSSATAPTAGQVLTAGSSTTATWNTARTLLTGNVSYNVATTGNDANPCTSLSPCLTIQRAINLIASTVDLGGFTATVNVAAGTYTGTISVTTPFVGAGTVQLTGDTTTPSNVFLNTSGSTLTCSGYATVNIKGFKIASSAGNGIYANGGIINVNGNMEMGVVSGAQFASDSVGTISITSNYTITGSAAEHFFAGAQSRINSAGITVTLTGTPAYTIFALASPMAYLFSFSMTFSGSATGTRYQSNQNSVIFVNGGGANYFPGNAAGSANSGGIYS